MSASKGQLDFTRSKANAGAQPWKGAFDQMMGSKYADGTRLRLGAGAESRLCGGSLKPRLGPVCEVGHNALAHRLGHAMTNAGTLTLRGRPAGSNNLFVVSETLTHGDNPA